MKKSILLPLSLLLALLPAHAQKTLHDYSNRISLYDTVLVGGFNDPSLDSFTCGTGLKATAGDGSVFGLKPHEGEGVLHVQPGKGIKANSWKTVFRTFTSPADFSGRPVAEYAIFTQEGPAIEQYTRLRLESGNQVFEAQAMIIPTLWRTVIFDLSSCPFLSKVEKVEIGLMCDTDACWDSGRDFLIDGLSFGKPLDLGFMLPSSTDCFKGTNGKITWKDDALHYKFKKGAVLSSPDMSGSRNNTLNPSLSSRNTMFIVLQNKSAASKVRLSWETLEGDSGSKDFGIVPHSGKKAYFFNISDQKEAKGHLKSFTLTPLDVKKGTWEIDQIRFERETPITRYAGEITSCTADDAHVRIQGKLDPETVKEYKTLEIYEYPLMDEGAPIEKLQRIYRTRSEETFDIKDLQNKRLGGVMTHLSTRFLAVVSDGEGRYMKVGPAFYIANWRDFTENPYEFQLPSRKFNVLDYGARGDAFTDDTKAIQKAIDACSKAGGGQVVLPGSDDPYGRRYVATNIRLRSNVDLHFEKGAILWQSYDLRDYTYIPAYGHDFDIPGCPWTHCLFINYPLLQGNDIENVKITGPGVIRMSDPYTVNPDWSHYARTCTDRIHICPIGISNSRNIEFTDIDELRSNNYHTNFQGDRNIFIGNVKLHEVQCVSGDGFSFGQGTHNVVVTRCFFNSNDDGIVLCNSYKDPRGKISPWRLDDDDADHSVRNVEVTHSYINSGSGGGGKAIALIPWGKTNPDQTKQELDCIRVYDCVLEGGHSVGTWCDNPHDGKPFTNTEEDDYAPVKDFRIIGNEYRSLCDILCVKPTTFITDCGLHSASDIVNGNFTLGHSYWTMEGNADAEIGYGHACDGGRIFEGIYLPDGEHVFCAEVCGDGELFAEGVVSGKNIGSKAFSTPKDGWEMVALPFKVEGESDVALGLKGGNAKFRRCRLLK